MKPSAIVLLAGLLAGAVFIPAAAAQKQLSATHVPVAVLQKKSATVARLAATNELHLALSLPLRDPAGLTDFLRDLNNPASPEFRHYLTPAQFTERFGPTPADYAALSDFARTNGFKISKRHPNRLVLDVTAKVSDVERAFHLRMNTHRHPREARNFFAPDAAPTVDAALPLMQVGGLDDFSPPHPKARMMPSSVSPRAGSGPAGSYQGEDFRKAYAPGIALSGAGQNIALVQFDGFYGDDITNYATACGLTNIPLTVVPVNGGVASPGGGNVEVALDIEVSLAMAPGISNIYVYEAPNPTPWVDILSAIANDNLAKQIGCSWGGGGPDAAAEIIFLQMAAQGQSFYNATGDSAALTGGIAFPSESPNITQVGGTSLTTDGSGNYLSETAWNWGGGTGSSGGISTVVPIPAWQLGLDMSTNHGSTLMRNVPDVALTADNIRIIYNNGTSAFVGGTSVAAPLWAAFTALINEQAGQLSQPPVGFLNPALYALARGTNYSAVFRDITTGNNTNDTSPDDFYATPGFDLCTGLGTPLGTNLINALTTPDNLQIIPGTVFAGAGLVGGPFTQTNWMATLTNTGAASLGWSLGNAPAWLSVSATAGTLAAGEATNISLQLTGAESLPAGDYLAALLVTNQNLGRVQVVAVRLDVGISIVENGGFETGDFSAWALNGYTVIGNNVYNVVTSNDVFPDVAHSGTYGAFLGQGGFLATLTQNLPTQPGQLYQLSFWVNNPVGGSPEQFAARWNLTNVVLNLINPSNFGWTNYQFVVNATGTNTQLRFFERNDPNYFGFDDVTVIPVPPVVFSAASASNGNLLMSWNSLAGLNYEVDYCTNLAEGSWQSLGNVTAATNTCGISDTTGTAGQRFYRLLLLP